MNHLEDEKNKKINCMQWQYNDYKWFYTLTWVLNIISVSFKWYEELNFDFIMFAVSLVIHMLCVHV